MRVHAEEEGAVDAGGLAVVADGLRDGGDVGVVEACLQRRAAVAGCSEGDLLVGDGDVRRVRIVSADEIRNVENELLGDGLAGERGYHDFAFGSDNEMVVGNFL